MAGSVDRKTPFSCRAGVTQPAQPQHFAVGQDAIDVSEPCAIAHADLAQLWPTLAGTIDEPLMQGGLGRVRDLRHLPLFQRIPWELRLLGYRSQPWTIGDLIAISRGMGYVQAAQHQADMERLIVQMVQAGVPRARLEELFPGRTDGLDVELVRRVRLGERLVPDSVRWATGLPRASASNNWAIAPARTRSGRAILASDPHLEINRLPAVWHESVVEYDGRFAVVATIPGLPLGAIGRTNHLAWGPTYGCMDTVDSWVEDCRDGHYRRHVDGQDHWQPFRTRTEVIERKRRPEVTLTFYENDHGVLDGDPHEPGLYLSTRWSGATPARCRCRPGSHCCAPRTSMPRWRRSAESRPPGTGCSPTRRATSDTRCRD